MKMKIYVCDVNLNLNESDAGLPPAWFSYQTETGFRKIIKIESGYVGSSQFDVRTKNQVLVI